MYTFLLFYTADLSDFEYMEVLNFIEYCYID